MVPLVLVVLLEYVTALQFNLIASLILILLSYSFTPLIGWLADVRFGRYIKLLNLVQLPLFWPAYCAFFIFHWRKGFYTEYCTVVYCNCYIELLLHMLPSSHASLLI